jgi:DNA-binding MarR family transcriptional regulator
VLWIAGPLESRRVAELGGMSRAAVSALVKTLDRDGYLHRRQPVHDRRMVELRLSDSGQDKMTTTFAAHNQREQLWADGLSAEERQTLIELLRKIMARRTVKDVRTRN